MTDNKGPDVIVEMLANVNLDRDLKAIASRGRIVIVGSRGPIEVHPRDIMMKRAEVHGVALFNTTPAEIQEMKSAIEKGLEEGKIKVRPKPVVCLGLPLHAEANISH